MITAQEYILKHGCGESDGWQTTYDFSETSNLMIEFAKLHVKEALKQASEKADASFDEGGCTGFVEEKSILNAYDLDDIK